MGYTIHFLILLEPLYLEDKKIFKLFNNAILPVFTALNDTKIFLINSGLGKYNDNFYKNYFTDEVQNVFKKYKYHYSLIHNRDEEWKNNIIKNIGKDCFYNEYELINKNV